MRVESESLARRREREEESTDRVEGERVRDAEGFFWSKRMNCKKMNYVC